MLVQLSRERLRPVAAIALAGTSLIAAAAVGSIFLRTSLDAWTTIVAPGPAGPADGILLMTGLAGTFTSLWLGLGMTLAALSALPGELGLLCRRLAGRVAPVAVRKVVAFLLGTTLTAALVPGTAIAGISHEAARGAVVATAQEAKRASSEVAVAAPDASFRSVSGRPPGDTAVAVQALYGHTVVAVQAVPAATHVPATPRTPAATHVPDTPRIPAAPVVGVVPAVRESTDAAPSPAWSPKRGGSRVRPALRTSAHARTDTVVVLRGDTLWSIAARHLSPAANAAAIEVEWHRWLATNRDVIGDDADLILPGQLLSPPPSKGTGS
jgi:nucleoid-associated protein YgaU